MRCIRTGCQIYIPSYGEFAYGDAFMIDGVYIFRLCERARAPINGSRKHFTVSDWDNWFDERRTSQTVNSTLIAAARYVADHGYDGTSIEEGTTR